MWKPYGCIFSVNDYSNLLSFVEFGFLVVEKAMLHVWYHESDGSHMNLSCHMRLEVIGSNMIWDHMEQHGLPDIGICHTWQ